MRSFLDNALNQCDNQGEEVGVTSHPVPLFVNGKNQPNHCCC